MSDVIRKEMSDEERSFLESLTKEALEKMFWGSPWQMDESETMARQTLMACKLNLAQHGDAFSWLGAGTRAITGGGLANNAKGLGRLLASGFIVQEDAPSGLSPPNDNNVVTKDGKPQVLRITRGLLCYARAELSK